MATKTEDYKQFKLMPGNRKVLKKHVDNIGVSMALHPEIFKIRPILVNDKMEEILRNLEDVYNFKQQKDIVRFY